jgi:hypothetical protein
MYFVKKIRSPDPFVQIWQPSRNIFQNQEFHQFPSDFLISVVVRVIQHPNFLEAHNLNQMG